MERQTRQRQAVLDALSRSGRTLSPPEILSLARRDAPALNLSTVYRQVKGLEEDGTVLRVQLPGQPARYEVRCGLMAPTPHEPTRAQRHGAVDGEAAHGHASAPPHVHAHGADDHHHHHFHCLVCDEVVPIHGCPGPMHELAPPGCEVERHDLVLHGRCARCAAQATLGQAA